MRLSESVKSRLFQRQKQRVESADYFNDSDLLGFNESVNGVDYIWSRDPKKLLTYRRIINQIYSEELGVDYDFCKLDEMDFRSYFYLTLPKNSHAGGCRVTVNNPYLNLKLPCESEGFSIVENFPELNFSENMVAEVSRFSLKREYRASVHYEMFFSMLRDLLTAHNVRYFLTRASVSRQKIYFRYARKYFNLVLQKDFEALDSNNLEYYFCIYENPNYRK